MNVPSDQAAIQVAGRVRATRHRLASVVHDRRIRDQLVTSVVNLTMPVAAALLLTSREVGAVWIAFGTYQAAIAICRGFIAIPGQISIGRQTSPGRTPALLRVATVPVLLGGLTAVVALLIRDHDVRQCLLVLAPTLPVLLLLDCARHWAYAVYRVDIPARASVVWAVTHIAAAAWAVTADPTAATLIAAWAIPGVVGGAVLILGLRSLADPSVTTGTSLRQRTFLAADALTGQLSGFVVPAVAGVVASLSDVGVFQNSRLLFRPVNVLLNMLLVSGIPSLARADDGLVRLQRTRSLAIKIVVVTCGLTAAGLAGYLVASVTTMELSWLAIALAAVESIAVGPYFAFALLATMMMRAGMLLAVRVAAVLVQVVGILLLAHSGAGGLAAASLAGMLVPSIVVPRWTTRVMRRADSRLTLGGRPGELVV